MKIDLAEYAGFCMGVRRAILKVIKELDARSGPMYVYGELIHNKQTMDVLARRGLKILPGLTGIKEKTLVIRTHGIPLEILREMKSECSDIVNLTCPKVAYVQGLIKRYANKGYHTIIIGDPDHAEVLSLKSYASSGHTLVSGIKDFKHIPKAGKRVAVFQTTQDKEIFNKISQELGKKYPDILIFNTICDSTYNRQDDIRKAVKKNIDTIVVIGGKHSANTKRLARIGNESGINTIHVETEKELLPDEFQNAKHILVTAGASTPGWIINNVMERLYEISLEQSNSIKNTVLKFLEILLRTNLLSALAAFFITTFVQNYNSLSADYMLSLTSSLYIFAMYTINNMFEIQSLYARNPFKYSIQLQYKNYLCVLAIGALLYSLYIIIHYGTIIISIYLLSCILGILYSTKLVNSIIEFFNSDYLIRIYKQKNLVSSLGWVVATVILPLVVLDAPIIDFISLGIFIFSLIIARDIILDIMAFQGDSIFGRYTLPTLLGLNMTRKLLLTVIITSAIVFSYLSILHGKYYHLVYLVNLVYLYGTGIYLASHNFIFSLKGEAIIDTNFVLFIVLTIIL